MTTAEQLLPAQPPSGYDRWTARVRANAASTRLWAWLAPTLVTLLAGVLRFANLGNPHALVFDETYYVKDAWSQWNLGFPATWPDGADAQFITGVTDIFTSTGSFVVHPPLGKWLIGAGMWFFGPESAVGWRFTVALLGTASVLVLFFVAKLLTRSTVFASIAGLLMAIDGLAIVLSRVALLDGILTFFILLTFLFVLLDRRSHLARILPRADGEAADWGVLRWWRPWLLAAGAAAGAASAVKWSGLYVLAAVGVYLIVTDALARRRAGIRFWPMDAIRQGIPTFLLLVPVAVLTYLVTWTGWFVTSGGYDRGSAANPLVALWEYHSAMYGFHLGLTTSHGYASPAWQWPLLLRPTSMYWNQDGAVEAISSIPNPLIWYGGVAAAIYLVYRFVVSRDWRYAFVLTGIAATYLPWLIYGQRTIFQFYTVAIVPFLILAATFALRDISGAERTDPARRKTGQRVVWVLLIGAVVLSAFWYPVWTAMPVPYDFWRIHNWIPSWI